MNCVAFRDELKSLLLGDAVLEREIKGEVGRKMNFIYVLRFVVLRDVVKVFPVSSSSCARKTTGRIRA